MIKQNSSWQGDKWEPNIHLVKIASYVKDCYIRHEKVKPHVLEDYMNQMTRSQQAGETKTDVMKYRAKSNGELVKLRIDSENTSSNHADKSVKKEIMRLVIQNKDVQALKLLVKVINDVDYLYGYDNYIWWEKPVITYPFKDKEILQILQRNRDKQLFFYGKVNLKIRNKRYVAFAPDYVLNILLGEIEWVKGYIKDNKNVKDNLISAAIERSGKALPWYSRDYLASENLFYIEEQSDNALFLRETKRYIPDIYTAAIISGSIEMIEFIAGFIKKIYWSEYMEDAIINASRKVRTHIIRKNPGIIAYFNLLKICKGGSLELFEKIISFNKEDLSRYGDETRQNLEQEQRYKEEAHFFRSREVTIPKDNGHLVAKSFLKLYELMKYKEIKELIRKQIFIEIYEAQDENEDSLVKAFKSLPYELHEDYTQCYLTARKRTIKYKTKLKFWMKKAKPLGSINPDMLSNLSIGEINRVVHCFMSRQDIKGLNYIAKEIIKNGSEKLFLKAIRRGYINGDNVVESYAYAIEQKTVSEFKLVSLMELFEKGEKCV